jgi:hypothetical protein
MQARFPAAPPACSCTNRSRAQALPKLPAFVQFVHDTLRPHPMRILAKA